MEWIRFYTPSLYVNKKKDSVVRGHMGGFQFLILQCLKLRRN